MTLTQAIYSAVGKLTQALCQSSLFFPLFTATLQVPIPQVCDFRVVYTCSRSFVGEEEGTVVA